MTNNVNPPDNGYREVDSHTDELWNTLYHAVNEMMGVLGAKGEISTRAKEVEAVMDALHEIDGGVYKEADNHE
jgi:hypothetical protein